MIRLLIAACVLLLPGFRQQPPKRMLPPENLPANRALIHPWIAKILSSDLDGARTIIKRRIATNNPRLLPLVQHMATFTPRQVIFVHGRGYVQCVAKAAIPSPEGKGYCWLVYGQPPDSAIVEQRVKYFDDSLRSTMREFYHRFAESGDETPRLAGQFVREDFLTVRESGFNSEDSIVGWETSTMLYHSSNGDAVFIKPNGATAWRVLETDQTIPLAATFGEFIEEYVAFRHTDDYFDSWSWRAFRERHMR